MTPALIWQTFSVSFLPYLDSIHPHSQDSGDALPYPVPYLLFTLEHVRLCRRLAVSNPPISTPLLLLRFVLGLYNYRALPRSHQRYQFKPHLPYCSILPKFPFFFFASVYLSGKPCVCVIIVNRVRVRCALFIRLNLHFARDYTKLSQFARVYCANRQSGRGGARLASDLGKLRIKLPFLANVFFSHVSGWFDDLRDLPTQPVRPTPYALRNLRNLRGYRISWPPTQIYCKMKHDNEKNRLVLVALHMEAIR